MSSLSFISQNALFLSQKYPEKCSLLSLYERVWSLHACLLIPALPLWTLTSSRSLCVMVDGWKTVSHHKKLKQQPTKVWGGDTSVSDKEKHFQRANNLICDLTHPFHMPALLLTTKGTENLSWTLHLNNYYSVTLIRTLTIFHWRNWIRFICL